MKSLIEKVKVLIVIKIDFLKVKVAMKTTEYFGLD